MFSHKQSINQTTREFLSEIRREGYRLLTDLDPEEREERMIEAFCDGLYNEDVRNALKHRRILTLEEAYNLIKGEKSIEKKEEHLMRRLTTNDNDKVPHSSLSPVTEIEKLRNQVATMQKQLNHITSILQSDRINVEPEVRAS